MQIPTPQISSIHLPHSNGQVSGKLLLMLKPSLFRCFVCLCIDSFPPSVFFFSAHHVQMSEGSSTKLANNFINLRKFYLMGGSLREIQVIE